MECFIDGKSTCERTFWNRLNVLANFQQKEMIMDGLKVRVAESMYWISTKERIVRLNYSFFSTVVSHKNLNIHFK